jgi:hypothetical protein
VCIVSLVLSLFALLTAVTAISGGIGAGNPFDRIAELGQTSDVVRVQRAMTAEIQAATQEWIHWYVVIVILNLALTGLLVSGSVLSLRMARPGDRLLSIGFAVGIAAEVVAAYPTIAVQRATMEVLNRWLPGLMAGNTASPGFNETLSSFVRASVVAGIAMAGIFALGKLGFFLWGLRTMRRHEIRERFAARPPR